MSTPERNTTETRSNGELAMRVLRMVRDEAAATGNPEYKPPEWLDRALELYESGDHEAAKAILHEHAEQSPEDEGALPESDSDYSPRLF